MAKTKTVYICQQCGYQSPKWQGKCNSCNSWNSFVEEVVEKSSSPARAAASSVESSSIAPTPIGEIELLESFRILTNDNELNRVLGGGIVPGSLILIGGEPGIGKSTLLLQLALSLKKVKVAYASGEESPRQIALRGRRLGMDDSNCYILSDTIVQRIIKSSKELNPGLLIIDSIQTMQSQALESAPGSVSQIRECTNELLKYAKTEGVPVFLIGHITKDGQIAGPKILEHMVDTVLQFEGDVNYNYRILRTSKNRFGSTAELGIYEMQNSGLRQVSNPSELLITQRDDLLSGIAIAATIEGQRPMMIEVQALVSPAVYGTPQRSSTGFDMRRLNMLLAVLEKRLGFQFGNKDVFLNIAGGIKVEDPAIDLAVLAALLSSFEDRAIPYNYCFAGEVGLSGEVRSVTRIDQRIGEAEKLGFEKIYISKYSGKDKGSKSQKIRVYQIQKIHDLYRSIFK